MSQYANGYAINTRIPKDLYLRIRKLAKEQGVSMSHLMRRAMIASSEMSPTKGTKKLAAK